MEGQPGCPQDESDGIMDGVKAGEAMFADIVIDNETQATDRIFTYAVPQGETLQVGQRVQVPFGPRNRRTNGFVLRLLEETDTNSAKMKTVEKIFKEVYFSAEDAPVIEEIRMRTLCSYMDAVRLFLPRGILKGVRFKTEERLTFVAMPEGRHDKEPYRAIAACVRGEDGRLIKADLAQRGFSVSSVNTMIRHGYLQLSTKRMERVDRRAFANYGRKTLNSSQRRAVDRILAKQGVYLLHGITGSGKTEVFLQLIEEHLEQGKDSIVLVPEISLTPQMIERFKGRFGGDITIYHSRMSEGERYDEWHRVRSGKVKIAVGARSALFLPFQNLGLVVIDEEHETSYKSDMNPKYHARDLAELFTTRAGGRLVLASATPSVETYHRAVEGDITLLELPGRATQGVLPVMESVDMRQELAMGNRSLFSETLKQRIQDALVKKEQVILFLNRRGFSPFVSCRSCGFVFKCTDCAISMTYHRDGSLMCHRCGRRVMMPKTCPSCASRYIKQFGAGTEKVEEEIRRLFPAARTLRMDGDTTKGKDAYFKMYETFKNKEADILIGTQMISKGLDFKDVTLVGILAADLSLNLPDFRAQEKTFQLITQVAGRAGRGDKAGHVVVQSYTPENPAVVFSLRHDYAAFYNHEIAARAALGNPPFSRILHIVISAEEENRLREAMVAVSEKVKKKMEEYDTIVVLGPSPCMIARIKKHHRHQMILKGDFTDDMAMALKQLVYTTLKPWQKEVKVSIDVNPTNMM